MSRSETGSGGRAVVAAGGLWEPERLVDPPRVHVAVVKPVFLRMILAGQKTAEARLSRSRRAPYTGLGAGEVVYFKATGGPVGARAVVSAVHRFELSGPGEVEALRLRFERALGGPGNASAAYWASKAGARYAAIVELSGVTAVEAAPAWYRPAADRSAWRVVETG